MMYRVKTLLIAKIEQTWECNNEDFVNIIMFHVWNFECCGT